MSMKSVELQIAIPRTSEAGKIQNELHHRSSQEQQFLAGQQIKASQQMRQRSTEVDESAHTEVRDEGKPKYSGQQATDEHKSQQETEQRTHAAEHPYKGHHLDVSL
ncbi:hypothetical protein [Paenibacillus pini]